MTKPSQEHQSHEFGRPPSTGIKGLDAPMIGAPSSIMLDGIVEQESGVTPPPPAVSVKAVVIVLVAMFLFGLIMLVFVLPSLPQ
jgi:hypothetical protein